MSGARLVRTQTTGYGERGHEVCTDEAYMQFLVSFMRDGTLGKIKGAPLSAFIAVGLHEAEVLTGIAEPFTLQDLMAVTKYSKPAMVDALDFLVTQRLIEELPERGESREKQYRIAAYMWFGPRRSRPRKVKSKESLPLKRNFPDDDDLEKLNSEEKINHQQSEQILRAAGIGGKNRERLAAVEPARLERWLAWTEHAPERFTSPVGFMISKLLDDPCAEPPESEAEQTWYGEYAKYVHR